MYEQEQGAGIRSWSTRNIPEDFSRLRPTTFLETQNHEQKNIGFTGVTGFTPNLYWCHGWVLAFHRVLYMASRVLL